MSFTVKGIQKVQGRYLVKHHLAAIFGFYTGVQLIDYFFYDEKPYLVQREQIEDEYWAKNGEPTEIQPYIIPSVQNPEVMRKSWIHIMYEKDRLVKKPDQLK